MNIVEADPTQSKRRTYSIRTILVATTLVAIAAGWFADHFLLVAKIRDLQTQLNHAERIQDTMKRTFMTRNFVGRNVNEFPNLGPLVDDVILPTHDYFRNVLDRVTYPEVLEDTDGCEIYCFELAKSGIEGDPSDFFLLISNGIIVKVRHGESLNY